MTIQNEKRPLQNMVTCVEAIQSPAPTRDHPSSPFTLLSWVLPLTFCSSFSHPGNGGGMTQILLLWSAILGGI